MRQDQTWIPLRGLGKGGTTGPATPGARGIWEWMMAVSSVESEDGKVVTIRVTGRFDFASHEAFLHAYRAYGRGEKRFVVDLQDAEYMDSSAMGMLLQLREYSEKDADVALMNGNETVREILQIANFDKLFEVA
jgi:anti-anti-sigma factor